MYETLPFLHKTGFFGVAIAITSTLMWWLILRVFLRQREDTLQAVAHLEPAFSELSASVNARQSRQYLSRSELHRLQQRMTRGISWIKVLVRILPLLGLLGTVDGIIISFEHLGGEVGIQQQLSNGISSAMLTTLSGLVTSLSGYYLAHYVQRRSQRRVEKVRQYLHQLQEQTYAL
ncbi:MotA/TolQ/ExbB proton channel family protein [Endozoicomonas gorgoniicola]|uniref:MotA/TolQ/ExbB proton channel family protein n=1 Tax=Endozoicomonas gorgoniicola TaxID=1234144 RepID=A0ABT3MSU6_9GAMM|nr:MotA/TolQ/ExbB proton channel family protein [Endozoicomonas gorgoniicola]MCW7552457.1 MotA/TolQ/ExbB proton channel family protein [Endozoicomonas gorgoniicola]